MDPNNSAVLSVGYLAIEEAFLKKNKPQHATCWELRAVQKLDCGGHSGAVSYSSSSAAEREMKSAISLLLVASVFACPLICHVGHAASRANGKSVAGCCCHGATDTMPAGDRSPGVPSRSHGSDGCCQGICGGAVMGNFATYNAALDLTWVLPFAVVEPVLLTTLQETHADRFCTAPWPDDGTNRGRELCCLFSTLLC